MLRVALTHEQLHAGLESSLPRDKPLQGLLCISRLFSCTLLVTLC
jgi:hypothetical protein